MKTLRLIFVVGGESNFTDCENMYLEDCNGLTGGYLILSKQFTYIELHFAKNKK